MNPFPGKRHICGHTVEGQPEILNGQLRPEGLRQRPVEIVAGKQAGDGIGEVEEADVAAHVGEPAAASRAHQVEVAVRAPQRAHEGADAHAAQLVDGDARLNDGSGHQQYCQLVLRAERKIFRKGRTQKFLSVRRISQAYFEVYSYVPALHC